MNKLSKHNDGFKFIMVMIDILSLSWLEPLKSKHGIAIKNAVDHIFSETIRSPKVIQTDKGTTFFKALVKTYLADNNIELFATHSERKAQFVEKLNRTIKGIMFPYFTKRNTVRYNDILQDIASKYNASYDRSIKIIHADVSKDNEAQVWVNLYEKRLSHKRRKISKFIVGDFARLTIKKTHVMKRYKKIWTEEVFINDAIVYGNPTTYKIKDQVNEPIKDILQARTSTDCGTQDISHRENDSKEKGGRSCIAICKVNSLPR